MRTDRAALAALQCAVEHLERYETQATTEHERARRHAPMARLAVERLAALVYPVVFVSGHLDLSDHEFEVHYKPRLLEHVKAGARFVVGDARGADAKTQSYLRLLKHANVVVFHMFDKPRNDEGFPTKGGFGSDVERDLAMTLASDLDLAWVRPGRESSGTAKNLARRATLIASEP